MLSLIDTAGWSHNSLSDDSGRDCRCKMHTDTYDKSQLASGAEKRQLSRILFLDRKCNIVHYLDHGG